MRKAKAIMVQGTGSGVGKSIIVAALCRIFLQDGYRVAPFKAQNMSLNSFVTAESGEIGRAQAVQAQACRIEPAVDMNPVLLKPTSEVGAQVILRGKPIGNMSAVQYAGYKPKLIGTVRKSLDKLLNEYDIVVIEGAGSPAEINLKAHDIVNMKMAEYANAPVILAADIDKGGVFAWLWGTIDLLADEEKKRIKALLINKFRGDKGLLRPGIRYLEKKTNKKVLGVIPYFQDISIPEEDSLAPQRAGPSQKAVLKIEVIKLPHISNFTDFDCLQRERGVDLKFLAATEPISPDCDILIIPGTKNTIYDFNYLKNKGYVRQIIELKEKGREIIGICGGFQMLGKAIVDPWGIESNQRQTRGLGFLNMLTTLGKGKILSQVRARELSRGIELSGYEIHHGRTKVLGNLRPVFEIIAGKGKRVKIEDGAKSSEGNVWGTYIHGIFDNEAFRKAFLEQIIRKNNKSLNLSWGSGRPFNQDEEFDKLARLVRKNIDTGFLYGIINH